MIERVAAIALNTFREAVRDRVLHAVVIMASLVVFGTLAMAQLSLDQEVRVVHDLGLVVVSLFAVIVSVFLGSSLMFKEMERKTLYVILPKPIHRYEFLLGKFFGIAGTSAVFIATIGAVFLVVLAIQSGGAVLAGLGILLASGSAVGLSSWKLSDPTQAIVPVAVVTLALACGFATSVGTDVSPLLGGLALCVCEVAVIASLALFFSSFSTPLITGLLTVGVWLVGRSADTLQTLDSPMLTPEVLSLLHGTARVVPNFVLFVPGERVLDAGYSWAYVAGTAGYAALYCAVLLTFASVFFHRRDLP